MKIDKDKLNSLMALSDKDLWCEIGKIAKSHGFNLPENAPPKSEMEKLRATVSGGTNLNLAHALKIINDYKRKAQK